MTCRGCKDPTTKGPAGGTFVLVGGPRDGRRVSFRAGTAPAVYMESIRVGTDPDGTPHYERHAWYRRVGYYLHDSFLPCIEDKP